MSFSIKDPEETTQNQLWFEKCRVIEVIVGDDGFTLDDALPAITALKAEVDKNYSEGYKSVILSGNWVLSSDFMTGWWDIYTTGSVLYRSHKLIGIAAWRSSSDTNFVVITLVKILNGLFKKVELFGNYELARQYALGLATTCGE